LAPLNIERLAEEGILLLDADVSSGKVVAE